MRERPDLTPALRTLNVPLFLIVGTLDHLILVGFHGIADALPRRRVVRFEGCVHGTFGQRLREWNQAVLDFLRDVDAGAPLGKEITL